MPSQQVLTDFARTCPRDVIAYNYDVLYTNDDVTTHPPNTTLQHKNKARTVPILLLTMHSLFMTGGGLAKKGVGHKVFLTENGGRGT
jgi:hypothetical protein